jgi:hypothetical protein
LVRVVDEEDPKGYPTPLQHRSESDHLLFYGICRLPKSNSAAAFSYLPTSPKQSRISVSTWYDPGLLDSFARLTNPGFTTRRWRTETGAISLLGENDAKIYRRCRFGLHGFDVGDGWGSTQA